MKAERTCWLFHKRPRKGAYCTILDGGHSASIAIKSWHARIRRRFGRVATKMFCPKNCGQQHGTFNQYGANDPDDPRATFSYVPKRLGKSWDKWP